MWRAQYQWRSLQRLHYLNSLFLGHIPLLAIYICLVSMQGRCENDLSCVRWWERALNFIYWGFFRGGFYMNKSYLGTTLFCLEKRLPSCASISSVKHQKSVDFNTFLGKKAFFRKLWDQMGGKLPILPIHCGSTTLKSRFLRVFCSSFWERNKTTRFANVFVLLFWNVYVAQKFGCTIGLLLENCLSGHYWNRPIFDRSCCKNKKREDVVFFLDTV